QLEQRLADAAVGGVGRQEDAADAVLPGVREREAQARALALKEAGRRLEEDTGAVARVLFTAAGAARLPGAEDLERFFHQVVRLAAGQIDDEAHAAGVVFIPGVVQPLAQGWQVRSHGYLALLGARGVPLRLGEAFSEGMPAAPASLPHSRSRKR